MSTSHVDNQSNQRDLLLFTPSTNILIICLIVLGLSTFLPLCVYHFYHVFVRRARLDSIKRHSTLCIAAITCLILSMIAQSMFQLVEFRTMRVSHGFRFTLLSAVILTNILFLNAQCIRFWLIWFHIEHYKLISVHEWKCIIDSHHNSKHSFFIRRKSSFGSPRFLCKCCLLETLLLIACIILIRFTVTDTAKREAVLYYGFVHIAVSYIALIVLLFKMSGNAFYDEFGVFNECKLLSLATTLTVSACILQVIGYEATANRLHLFASNAVSIVYLCAVYVMSMCCSTWCVYIMRSNSTAKVTNKQATNLSESASSKKLKLCDILAKNEYLSSFVVHLSQEMSLEVFLSMVEFIQFRAEIMKHVDMYNVHVVDARLARVTELEFADIVPVSSIVSEAAMDWKQSASALYARYVANGSSYEINVPYEMRAKLRAICETHNLFQRQLSKLSGASSSHSPENTAGDADVTHGFDWRDAERVACLFDECILEMMQLLNFSLARFKCKPEFDKLMNHQAATVMTQEDAQEIIDTALFAFA